MHDSTPHDSPLTMVEPGKNDPKSSTTWVVAAMSVGLLVTIVLLTDAFFHSTATGESDRKKLDYVNPQLLRIESEQQQQLQEYRLLDAETGRVAIPIDVAISKFVTEHQ